MNRVIFALAVLAFAQQALGNVHYVNYVLHPRTVHNEVTAASLQHCTIQCAGSCTAVSFNEATQKCLMTYCGNHILVADDAFDSVVQGSPVISGVELPYATHEYPLTDRCGTYSYGQNMDLALINDGSLGFKNKLSDRHGNAVYFTGANTGSYYLRSIPDASFAKYTSKDVSLSVAFYVNFASVPKSACLLEFRQDKAFSWHYWLWPDGQNLFYNAVSAVSGSQYLQTPLKTQANVWYHFAYVYDASTGQMITYVNGNQTSSQFLLYSDRASLNSITIGGRFTDNSIGYFEGSYYCLGLYDKPLTPFQVTMHQRSCVNGQVRTVPKEVKND